MFHNFRHRNCCKQWLQYHTQTKLFDHNLQDHLFQQKDRRYLKLTNDYRLSQFQGALDISVEFHQY
jgi:hypothetical protein